MSDPEGSEGSVAMEEDQDDDLYNPSAARSNGQAIYNANQHGGEQEDDDGDEDEDDDDDSDMVIVSYGL